jgi:hypothetical protein
MILSRRKLILTIKEKSMGCGWEPKYKPNKWDKLDDAWKAKQRQEAYDLSELFKNNPATNNPAVLIGMVAVAAVSYCGYRLWNKFK